MKRAMTSLQVIGIALTLAASTGLSQPQLITASLELVGAQPSDLRSFILDPNSDYTLAGPTIIRIKNQEYSYVTSPYALGFFGQGTIAPGTSMQDPVDPDAVFAGGIGLESGVCLSTGYVSDLDSPQANPARGREWRKQWNRG